jgi:DNA-binding protein HU-beta
MTKSQLQLALAQATQSNKKTAGALLNALGLIAYQAVKKEGAFVLPGFGKLVKQKRAARTAFNPQTRQKVKVAAKTVIKFRVAKGGPRTRFSGPRQPRRGVKWGSQARS